jgi:hypothetical protein
MVKSFFGKMLHRSMIWMLMASGALFAADICELTFSGCPETFNGQTIVVPDNVVKISSLLHVCKASQTLQLPGSGGPASILFVIDNTGSMKSNGGNDPTGARFNVTKDLLDTIKNHMPDAEVGLLVFREHLFFDTSTSQFYYTKYFKALIPVLDGEPYQAYLPFMKLGQTYDGKRGIDIMKDILTTNASGGDLVYQPNYRNLRPLPVGVSSGETNINGAFIGAKQAFVSAANTKDQQYIIFLGDGEPAGSTQAGLDPNYFTTPAGVTNVPTTFTVFFNAQGITPPTLVTMTNNIKVNGYSASNPKSNLWTINASYNSLMTVLMQNVILSIMPSGNPTKMTLNGKTTTFYIDSSFFFTDSFPLTNALTSVSMSITYRYVNPQTNILADTIVQITFNIQKSAGAPLPPGVSEICTPGAPGSVPVTAILADTNQEGHLDRIDLTWTDTAAINQTMPTVAQFVKALEITSLDGGKVPLTAVSIKPDLANKVIHVTLQENTGPILETGWQNVNVVLTAVPMTISGAPFVVTRIVDGAAPVIKSVCFVPTSVADSLRVVFSEPVMNLIPPLNPNNVFTLYTKTGIFTFTSSNSIVIKNNDNFIYVFNSNTLTNLDSLVEGNRPAFHLALCGNAPIITGNVPALIPYRPKITMSDRGCLISFGGYNKEDLRVALFSVKGQSVAELKAVDFGRDAILWNYRDRSGRTVSNGLYVLEIRAGTRVIQQRIIVTRQGLFR